jgi:hypothetical protein
VLIFKMVPHSTPSQTSVSGRLSGRLRVAFVMHVMHVAGAEVLVAETIHRLAGRIEPVVLCLDSVGTLGERLLAEGVPVVSLGRRPGRDWRLARELRDREDQRYSRSPVHALFRLTEARTGGEQSALPSHSSSSRFLF